MMVGDEVAGGSNAADGEARAVDLVDAARSLLESGEAAAAADQCRTILEVHPQNQVAQTLLGQALYQLQEWTSAEQVLSRAVEQMPRDVEPSFWRGMALWQLGRLAEAGESLETAAEGGHLEAHWQVALLYARQGRRAQGLRERSIEHLQTVVEARNQADLSEGFDRVYCTLGSLYAEDPEALAEAIAAYRRGLSINPLSPGAHNSLGTLLMDSGQTLGALGEFKVAIQLDPDFHAAYVNLARLLFKHVKPTQLAEEFGHVSEDFGDRAAQVLARLSLELVELGKEQVYEGLYTKGHQLKNLIGVVGSRLRSATRRLAEGEPVREELVDLTREHERLYEEWVAYLSVMTPDQLHATVFEPSRMAQRVVDALESEDTPGRLVLRVQDGVPRLEGDERLLREVVTNLCLNALEALESDGGLVSVGVGHDPDRGVVFIEVEDDGPGIAAGKLGHVFDPGFTTKKQGNGYGLTIARRIAQAHHGELRVKSRMGHGTVFRLDVPVNHDGDGGPSSLTGTHL